MAAAYSDERRERQWGRIHEQVLPQPPQRLRLLITVPCGALLRQARGGVTVEGLSEEGRNEMLRYAQNRRGDNVRQHAARGTGDAARHLRRRDPPREGLAEGHHPPPLGLIRCGVPPPLALVRRVVFPVGLTRIAMRIIILRVGTLRFGPQRHSLCEQRRRSLVVALKNSVLYASARGGDFGGPLRTARLFSHIGGEFKVLFGLLKTTFGERRAAVGGEQIETEPLHIGRHNRNPLAVLVLLREGSGLAPTKERRICVPFLVCVAAAVEEALEALLASWGDDEGGNSGVAADGDSLAGVVGGDGGAGVGGQRGGGRCRGRSGCSRLQFGQLIVRSCRRHLFYGGCCWRCCGTYGGSLVVRGPQSTGKDGAGVDCGIKSARIGGGLGAGSHQRARRG